MWGLWTSLTDLFNWLVDAIVCAMKQWVCWFMELLVGWIEPIFNTLLDSIGQPPEVDLTGIASMLGAASYWFPVSEAAGLAASYLVFKAGFLAIYLVKRWIPTMG